MKREELLKIAKPILFNTEMVQAILEGRKTVTRRVVKPQVLDDGKWGYTMFTPENHISFRKSEEAKEWFFKLPYVKGDILYVRETWTEVVPISEDGTWDWDNVKIYYYANDEDREVVNNIDYVDDDGFLMHRPFPWKPSIHMPKKIARIILKITDVRVERLQDITIEDIEREGLYCEPPYTKEHYAYTTGMRIHWMKLWNSTIKKQDLDRYGWEANPYAWVIEFERVEVE